MKKIDYNHIKEFYNQVENVWQNDPWHNYSQMFISQFIQKHNSIFNNRVLNAGSAGNDYGIICNEMYHVDIAYEKIKTCKHAICSNIVSMPLENNSFDSVLCVGSVINYCDAIATIREFSRIICDQGYLILEFESSDGFEYLHMDCYGQDAYIIETSYIEESHIQWIYSPKYIKRILKSTGFRILIVQYYHILDGLAYRFISESNAVALSQKTDFIVGKIPILGKHGNNVIILCQAEKAMDSF